MKMRRWVLLSSALVSWLTLTHTMEPDDVTAATDTVEFLLSQIFQETESKSKKIEETLKALPTEKSLSLLKKQNQLVKLGRNVGRALKAIQAVSVVASFIIVFYAESDFDVVSEQIDERFKEVNTKLDNLDEKLDIIENSIRMNTAFNTFLSKWLEWEYATKNGAKKLSDIRRAMTREKRRIGKVKLAEEFVNYYETNNLDGNMLNLYRMTALPEDTTNRNLFDRFIAEYGCDVSMLAQLMIIIQRVMTSAAQQKLSYYHLKGDERRAVGGFKEVQDHFFEIRRAFDDRVWNCRSNTVSHAKADSRRIVKEMRDKPREWVSLAIFNELKVKYPWYTWTVAAAENAERTKIYGLEWRGATYFEVGDDADPNKIQPYYVVYEDTMAYSNCNELKQAQTFLVFKRCKKCNSDYVYSARNILSGKTCPASTLEEAVLTKKELLSRERIRCSDCSNGDIIRHFDGLFVSNKCAGSIERCKIFLSRRVGQYEFIAAAINTNNDACDPSKCSGNGQCKTIAYTGTHQCICASYYDGDACENRITFDDTIEKMISGLRRTFNEMNGVPTAVDVYYSIRSLKDKLAAVFEKIKSSFAHTNNIIQHSKIIYNAEDVADLYGQLQKGELTFHQFGQKMDRYLKTVTTEFVLQNRLKKMILGQGTLDVPGKDIYNTYKREYLSQFGGGCSEQYNTDIANFRDNLAYLDQAVGEALLLHQKWLITKQGTTEEQRVTFTKEAEYIYNVFKNRQEEYNQYWGSHSCGPIAVNGTNVDCKPLLTYDGFTVNLECNEPKAAFPSKLTCERAVGGLEWDSRPMCKHVWGSWGTWSKCSAPCDGGLKHRYRNCVGADIQQCILDQGGTNIASMTCNNVTCCSERFGKHLCPYGQCISTEELCDGFKDCIDGSDEEEERCPNQIRAGDMVSFENVAKRAQWLSCYCTVNCGVKQCKLSGCPGSTVDENDWNECTGERFIIHHREGTNGQVLRHGDAVGVQYGWDVNTGRGNWLSCLGTGNYCRTRECPGLYWDSKDNEQCRGEMFWIFSPQRLGKCMDGNIESGCIGDPIEHGDTIFLMYATPSWAVGEKDGYIQTKPCPGKYIEQSDINECRSDAWKIFRMKTRV